jgi:hypothetical protein
MVFVKKKKLSIDYYVNTESVTGSVIATTDQFPDPNPNPNPNHHRHYHRLSSIECSGSRTR